MQEETGAFFSHSRSFKRVLKTRKDEGGTEDTTPAPEPEVSIISKYGAAEILMSGWAMGEKKYLKQHAALLDVPSGNGHFVLFGFRPQFRGQSRGTYKLIFNAIYMGAID